MSDRATVRSVAGQPVKDDASSMPTAAWLQSMSLPSALVTDFGSVHDDSQAVFDSLAGISYIEACTRALLATFLHTGLLGLCCSAQPAVDVRDLRIYTSLTLGGLLQAQHVLVHTEHVLDSQPTFGDDPAEENERPQAGGFDRPASPELEEQTILDRRTRVSLSPRPLVEGQ